MSFTGSSSSPSHREDSPNTLSPRPRTRLPHLPSPALTTPPPDHSLDVRTSPKKGAATSEAVEPPRSLPPSILSVLQLLCRLWRGSSRLGEAEADVYPFDISQQDYALLWALLGEGVVETTEDTQVLPSELQTHGLPSSTEELRDLGCWVLDRVRYDFFSDVDSLTGEIETRLWIRMPTVIHDQTANDIGQLIRDAVKPKLGAGEKVIAASMRCEFSDRLQRMLALEKGRRKTAEASPAAQAAAQATTQESEHRPELHQLIEVPSAAQAGGPRSEGVQEKERYEEAQPDVCVFVGDGSDIFPAVIVEVGFSHPLPTERARSYIYGSDGYCRVVITLDIEYLNRQQRLQMYAEMSEQQRLQRQTPAYRVIVNLFRCVIKATDQHDTYAAKHELKDVDARELARLGKALEFTHGDLHREPADEGGGSGPSNDDSGSNGREVGTADEVMVRIPFDEIVKIVDDAAWSQALRDEPSLRQPKKRKRELVAKLPSSSPEPEVSATSTPRPVKRARTQAGS